MTEQRRTLAVTIETPGGDDPLLVELIAQPPFYRGIALANVRLRGKGGTAPYAYTIISGSLPTGTSLNGTTGAITGTPSTQGHFAFVAEVQDSAANTYAHSFAMDILSQLFVVRGTPQIGEIGVAYSFQFVVRDATGTTITTGYTLASGNLPAGLSINTSGTITGMPVEPYGISYFTVNVTNGGDSLDIPCHLEIAEYMTAEWDNESFFTSFVERLPDIVLGIAWEEVFSVINGGVPPFSFTLGAGWPMGFHIRRLRNGPGSVTVAGKAPLNTAEPNDYEPVTIVVTDALGATLSVQRVVYIRESQRPITTSKNGAVVGEPGPLSYDFEEGNQYMQIDVTDTDGDGHFKVRFSPNAGVLITATTYHVEFDDLATLTQKQLHIPYAFQITGISGLFDAPGDVVIDLLVTDFASYPPGTGDSICGGNPLVLTATDHAKDDTLTDWTPLLPADSTVIVDASGVATLNSGTVTIWGLLSTPAPQFIVVSGGPLPDAMEGDAYLHYLDVTGGYPPYISVTFTPTLPDGLFESIVADTSGFGIEVSGTPTTSGAYSGTVQVGDGLGNVSNQYPVAFDVAENPTPPFSDNNLLAHPEWWTDASMNCPPADWDGTGYLFPSDSDSRTYTLNADVVITADHFIGWQMVADDPFAPPNITVDITSADGVDYAHWRADANSTLNNYGFVKGTDAGVSCTMHIDVNHHGYLKPYFPAPVVTNVLAVASNFEDELANTPPACWDGTSYTSVASTVIDGLIDYSGTDFFAAKVEHAGDHTAFEESLVRFTNPDTSFYNLFEAASAGMPIYLWFQLKAPITKIGWTTTVFSSPEDTVLTPFTGGPT